MCVKTEDRHSEPHVVIVATAAKDVSATNLP
jgi:hypothetical protein